MAQIDNSIYANQTTPDFLGSFEKGMKLREMHTQRKEKDAENQKKKAIESAFAKALTQSPDGSIKFDQNAVVKGIADAGYSTSAYETQNSLQKQAFENEQQKWNKIKQQNEMTGQLLNGVVDQATYDAAKAQAQRYGMDISQLPPQYNPAFINQAKQQVLTVQQQLDNQFKERGFEYGQKKDERAFGIQEKHNANIEKQQLFDNKIKLATLDNTLKSNDGQKVVDKEFAKDYNDWTSGGAKSARSEIAKLKNVVSNLKDGIVTTGGLTGMFPDRMTSDNLLQARSDVQSTVMNSLKSIMGASFTEKEGERVIKNTWNEADTTANNLARLQRLVDDLENQANDKDSKAAFFKNTKGTLSGYDPASSKPTAPVQKTSNKADYLKQFSDKHLDNMSPEELALLLRDAKGGG